jgi:hypothetical protein
MVNILNNGFLRTIPILLKIFEFVLVLVVLLISCLGIDGTKVTWGHRSDIKFIGIGSGVGYAILIPAIILTYLLEATSLVLEFIINLIGGLLFIAMGALVVETGIPTIFVILIIFMPILIPAIISTYLLGVIPSVLEFVINLVGGALFIAMGDLIFEEELLQVKLSNQTNQFNGISIVVGCLAISLGIMFLMDFILLCVTAKYTVCCKTDNVHHRKASVLHNKRRKHLSILYEKWWNKNNDT